MIEIHLFGATTGSGESFRIQALSQLPNCPLFTYSRFPGNTDSASHFVDFNSPHSFHPAGDYATPSIWISFAPIWLFGPFLEHLVLNDPQRIRHLSGVIACSSSSVLTKRYAYNSYDRELASCLSNAEDQLLSSCRALSVHCQILRPSIIYGQVGKYDDRNLSRLLQVVRKVPVLPVPKYSGLRQPIHASQLAAAALRFVSQIDSGRDFDLPERIALGGDTNLSYISMIRCLQQAQPDADPARRCHLIPIPNRLFFLLAAPLLLLSPKLFEAVLRISSNLSGFTPVHQLLGSSPHSFPVLPLD